jgi:hypothetical protein
VDARASTTGVTNEIVQPISRTVTRAFFYYYQILLQESTTVETSSLGAAATPTRRWRRRFAPF